MPSSIETPDVLMVTFSRPAWRYLLLFQSWSQLQSWALFVIAMNVLIYCVLRLSETRVLPVEGALIGTVLGSLCSVIMVLPTQFIVTSNRDYLFNSLSSELKGRGYVLLGSQKDIVIYRQNLPRLLRWDEGNVAIERTADCLIVKGPFMMVKKVRNSLLERVTA